ncbi:MAG: hypothetical protein ACRDBL_15485 [Rhabdaerophilum sp.]
MAKPEIKRPRKAQIYMLFDETPKPDLAELVEFLKPCFKSGDDSPSVELYPTGFIGWGNFFASVSVEGSHLPRKGFELTLTSPVVHHWAPDAEAAIARNKAYMIVEVSFHSPLPDLPPDMEAAMENAGAWPRPNEDQFFAMLLFAQHMTLVLAKKYNATLIQWLQSDQLFSVDNFTSLALTVDPVPLYVHPVLYGVKDPITGQMQQAAFTVGAAHLIGREIEFEPADVPPSFMSTRMLQFVEMVRVHRKGELIPHGETFGIDENEVIRVLHTHPTTERPQGGITLRLESGPGGKAQPVRPPPQPTREAFQPAKLNKDVAADRALIKAMRQSLISQSAGKTSPKAQQPAATAAPSRKSGVLGKIKTAIKSAVLVYAAIVAMSMISMFLAKDLMSAHQTQHDPNIVRPAKP